jgi:ribosomal-protein-alanine N-acetyltransferase
MKYQIRPLEEKDIPAVIAGETEVFGDSLGFDMIYSDIKLNPYAHYLVLEIDDEVGGYIGLWITEDDAEILNFYIAKRYQGLGFGSLLLGFAIDLCERCNVASLSLEVRENNHVARNLYEKHGFEFSHRREKYYQDGSDALLLIKKLEVKK